MALVAEIADNAGIGLVDSLIHPGSSAKYYLGKKNPNYLGTLSIYGFSPKVYNFLYTKDKINPASSQSLFFIKSRISQVCTPFSEGRFDRKIHVVQVTNNPLHMAPFTDIPVQMDSTEFLRALKDKLAVDPALRNKRMATFRRCMTALRISSAKFRVSPCHPTIFFSN